MAESTEQQLRHDINSTLLMLNSVDKKQREDAEDKITILETIKEYYVVLLMNICSDKECDHLKLISALMLRSYVFKRCDDVEFVQSLRMEAYIHDYVFMDEGMLKDIYFIYFLNNKPLINSILLQIIERIATKKYTKSDSEPFIFMINNTMDQYFTEMDFIKSLSLLQKIFTYIEGIVYTEIYIKFLYKASNIVKEYLKDNENNRHFCNNNELSLKILPVIDVVLRKLNKYTTNHVRFLKSSDQYICIKNIVEELRPFIFDTNTIKENMELTQVKFSVLCTIYIQFPYVIQEFLQLWFNDLLETLKIVSNLYYQSVILREPLYTYEEINNLARLILFCLILMIQWGESIDFLISRMDSFIDILYKLSLINLFPDCETLKNEIFGEYSASVIDNKTHVSRLFVVFNQKHLFFSFPYSKSSDVYLNYLKELTTDCSNLLSNTAEFFSDYNGTLNDQFSNLFDNWDNNMALFLDENEFQTRDFIACTYFIINKKYQQHTFICFIRKLYMHITSLENVNKPIITLFTLVEAYYFLYTLGISTMSNSNEISLISNDITISIESLLQHLTSMTSVTTVEHAGLYSRLLLYLCIMCNKSFTFSKYADRVHLIIKYWCGNTLEHSIIAVQCIRLLNQVSCETFDFYLSFIMSMLQSSESISNYITVYLDAFSHLINLNISNCKKYFNQIFSLICNILWKYYQNVCVCTLCTDILMTLVSHKEYTEMQMYVIHTCIQEQLLKPYNIEYISVFMALCDLCITMVSKKLIEKNFLDDYFYFFMKILELDETYFLEKTGKFMTCLLWNYTDYVISNYDGDGVSLMKNIVSILGRIVNHLLTINSSKEQEISILNILLEAICINVPRMIKDEDMLSIILNLSKLTLIGNPNDLKYSTICFIQLFSTDPTYMLDYTCTMSDVFAKPMIFSIVKYICSNILTICDDYIKLSGIRILANFFLMSYCDRHPIIKEFNNIEYYKSYHLHNDIPVSLTDHIASILVFEYALAQKESLEAQNTKYSDIRNLFKNYAYLVDYYQQWIEYREIPNIRSTELIKKVTDNDLLEYKNWIIEFVTTYKDTAPFAKFFL